MMCVPSDCRRVVRQHMHASGGGPLHCAGDGRGQLCNCADLHTQLLHIRSARCPAVGGQPVTASNCRSSSGGMASQSADTNNRGRRNTKCRRCRSSVSRRSSIAQLRRRNLRQERPGSAQRRSQANRCPVLQCLQMDDCSGRIHAEQIQCPKKRGFP